MSTVSTHGSQPPVFCDRKSEANSSITQSARDRETGESMGRKLGVGGPSEALSSEPVAFLPPEKLVVEIQLQVDCCPCCGEMSEIDRIDRATLESLPQREEFMTNHCPKASPNVVMAACIALLLFTANSCTQKSVSEDRYIEPDRLFTVLEDNVRDNEEFEVIVDIDHSRLAAKAGSPMPPAHVLIWSDPKLDASILRQNPLAGLDLPLRALAFENQDTGKAEVIANSYDFLAHRHSLAKDGDSGARYEAAIAKAMNGIPESAIGRFPSDSMTDAGLVTLDSPYDFATTEKRIKDAINAQSDTVNFGEVDFAARSRTHGVELPPMRLLLFGGPGPGGKAMASAPTLGLDAFCQKLLIWQDTSGTVHVSFNDLLALAERQQVSGGLPLRVINRRIRETFSTALKDVSVTVGFTAVRCFGGKRKVIVQADLSALAIGSPVLASRWRRRPIVSHYLLRVMVAFALRSQPR